MEPTVCNQEGCGKPAEFRFTWPGKDEAGICGDHAIKLRMVSDSLGVHVQLIPVDEQREDGK